MLVNVAKSYDKSPIGYGNGCYIFKLRKYHQTAISLQNISSCLPFECSSYANEQYKSALENNDEDYHVRIFKSFIFYLCKTHCCKWMCACVQRKKLSFSCINLIPKSPRNLLHRFISAWCGLYIFIYIHISYMYVIDIHLVHVIHI